MPILVRTRITARLITQGLIWVVVSCRRVYRFSYSYIRETFDIDQLPPPLSADHQRYHRGHAWSQRGENHGLC